jgi:TRAP-type transport system periplasmic protein
MSTISRRRLLQAAAALPIGAGFAGTCIGRASAAPLKLKLATPFNTDPKLSPTKILYDRLTDELKKTCGDEIIVELFPDSQLGSDPDLIPQLKFGTVDMTMMGFAIFATVIPDFGVLDLGYTFDSFDHFCRSMDGAVGKSVEATLMAHSSIIVLGWSHSLGARNVLTKKPVKVPEDLAGMRIRSLPAPPVVDTVRAMGGLPTPMPIGEAYVSLQTGLVDGIEHDATTMLAAKFFEAAKFLCLTQHTFQAIPLLMSKRAFDRIPAKYREGFLAAAKEGVRHEREMAVAAEAEAMAELQQKGVTVTKCDRSLFEARVRPLWADYVAKYPKSKPILDGLLKSRA